MKKIVVFSSYLFLNVITNFAQSDFDINYKQPNIILPQVAEIMKYVDYKTNLYNGLVDINIPLYEIREGDLVLPISISYHSSGLRHLETSGKVGMGWTLNAEPSVSRKINGKADEKAYLFAKELPTVYNANTASPYNPYLFYKGAMEDLYDLEPDAFYYKLADKSGKFYYKKREPAINNPNNEIITLPYEPIKISERYYITDENGVQYNFNGGKCWADDVTTQWLAGKMTSANNKNTITFAYTPAITEHNPIESHYATQYIVVEEDAENYGSTPPQWRGCVDLKWPFVIESYDFYQYGGVFNIEPDPAILNNPWYDATGKLIYEGVKQEVTTTCSGQYQYSNPAPHTIKSQNIETITSQYAEIKFFYNQQSPSKQSLIRIEIKDRTTNEIIRKIHFVKSSNTIRHQLSELRITDKNDALIEKYTFEYQSQLDGQAWNFQDHWGFASRPGSGIVPADIPWQIIRAKKAQNIVYEEYRLRIGEVDKMPGGNYGMLKSITYPTGRKSTFFFENHKYLHSNAILVELEGADDYLGLPATEIKAAGGVRIKKMEEYDPVSGQKYIKEYKYGETEDGLGHVTRIPSVKDYYYEYYTVNESSPVSIGLHMITKTRKFLPYSLAKMNFDGGSSTVYDFVTEYQSTVFPNGNEVRNGKITYQFNYDYSSYEEHQGHIVGTPLNLNSNITGWDKGLLLEKNIYKFNANSYTLTEKNTFDYWDFNRNYIPFCEVFASLQSNGTYDLYIDPHGIRQEYEAFKIWNGTISTGAMRLVFEQKETYTDNGIVTHRKDYMYDNNAHLYPTKIVTKNGDNDIKTEEFIYPQDISSPGAAEQKLVEKNRLNVPLIKKITLDGRTWTNRTFYTLDENNSLPESVWAGINGSEEERVKIHRNDLYGNPIFITKDSTENIVYLWGYNGQYPVAKIENTDYETVKTVLGAGLIKRLTGSIVPSTNDLDAINNLRTSLPSAQITTYTYKPLVGMLTATDPRGITTYYEYDAFGRLKRTYMIEGGTEKTVQQYNYRYRNQ